MIGHRTPTLRPPRRRKASPKAPAAALSSPFSGDTARLYAYIGRAMRVYRELRGWTQAEAATRMGLRRSAVTGMESGTQRVLLEHLVRLMGPRRYSRMGVSTFLPARLRK